MKLKINDSNWVVKILEQEEMLKIANESNDKYYFGQCYYQKQEIYITSCIHKDRLEKTIIHELVHAFIDIKNQATQTECDYANFFADNYTELLNKAEDVYKWAKEELWGEV